MQYEMIFTTFLLYCHQIEYGIDHASQFYSLEKYNTILSMVLEELMNNIIFVPYHEVKGLWGTVPDLAGVE